MKQKNLLKIAIFLLLLSNMSYAQLVTTIDFETENSGYALSNSEGNSLTDVFNRVNNDIGGNTTFKFAIEDTNITPANIQLDQIDITGSDSFVFSIDMLSRHYDQWDAGDELKILYSIDGGSYQNLMWVQNTAGGTNAPAAIDTDFDGQGECGINTTLPANTIGTSEGCPVSNTNFATFVTNSISLSSNSTLDIRLEFEGLTSTNEGIYLDNIIITETTPSTDTTVSFNSASSTVSEDGTSIDICVGITNPDASSATTVEVALNEGSTTASNPGDYTPSSAFTTTLTFPANSSTDQCITINLTNDSNSESNEVLVLDLQNAAGGNSATLGTTTQHTLTITDDDLPNIIINEILADPTDIDANGDGTIDTGDDEFIEFVNLDISSYDLTGYTISDAAGLKYTFGATIIPAGGSVVVFAGGTPTGISGITVTAGSLALNNSGDTVTLANSGATTIATYTYGSEANSAESIGRNPDLTGNFVKHETISSNPVSASPGRYNSSNLPFSTLTWTGATDNAWTTGSNWSTGTAPTTSDDVQILKTSNQPTVSTAVTVNSATINSGATLIATNSFTGSVTYNRALANAGQWYYMSSPVLGEVYDNDWANANSIATGQNLNRGVSLYNNTELDIDTDDTETADTATDYWRYLQSNNSNSGTFNIGQGYGIILSSPTTVSFAGTGINTATQNIAITQSESNFNLVGNPFTAYLNLGDFFADNNGTVITDASAYFWNGSIDDYDTRTSSLHGSFEIAPGQGFFVEAAANTNLTFDITDVTHQSSPTFQKNARPEINLFLSDGNNKKYANIYYIDGTTTGFDNGYDGKLFGGVARSFALYSHLITDSEGENFQLQSLPNSNHETMVIPVGVKVAANKEITFSVDALNLPADINVYLEDRLTNTFTRLDEANSSYKVTSDVALDGIGRFYLHTKNSSALSVDTVNMDNISIYKTTNSNLRVVGISQGKASIKFYSIVGKQVFENSFTSNGVQDIILPALSSGIYIVQLETETGSLNKKITLE